jgi:2-amino-4-hydroxy-6-hydroxymethyldihydropteridine diphosphokinase
MHQYLIALGSNQRHPTIGRPRAVLGQALIDLAAQGVSVSHASAIMESAPVGPSMRRYANAAAIVETASEPEALLDILQSLETNFGRRRMGQRWRARVLDLDIILWSGGCHTCERLSIPHISFRTRDFVLQPACQIAGHWRDPVTNLNLRQLLVHQQKRPGHR